MSRSKGPTGTAPAKPECIRLRGVRQNNLKGFDLDIPLGRYVVVTGLSGAGKSSLVFETLHAEGQRRSVETFSAYTRQFLELLDKPRVDSIENIPPSIAIEQTNTVKSSRSTVGTMTELTDFFKVWFSHAAECFDPETGEKVEDDNPQTIWRKTLAASAGRAVLVAFEVAKPDNLSWREILTNLKNQTYVRVLAARATDADLALHRVDELLADPGPLSGTQRVHVVQDRIQVEAPAMARFLEAAETAMHFGRGEVRVFAAEGFREVGHYSRGLHSPKTGRKFRAATPPLFSFNSPLGACPQCRGFGRIIEIDYRLAIPDPSLSIDEGAIRCWEGAVYSSSKDDLRKFTRKLKIPTDVPFSELTPAQRSFIVDGEPGYGEENGKEWPKSWYGVKGFFRWLEKTTYKMHVRVFLSRYRAYNTCPACGGKRLQPESLCWKWRGFTLPGALRRSPSTSSSASSRAAQARLRRAPGRARLRLHPDPPALPARGGPRLPDDRPSLAHALGRRGRAREPDRLPRHVARRHALRHGRAERRASPAGHQPAGSHHPLAGRRRQHGRGRRARRGDDPRGRARDRDRARAGSPRRTPGLPGKRAADAPGQGQHHRGLFFRTPADHRSRKTPASHRGRVGRPFHRRKEAQPPGDRRAPSAQALCVPERGLRLRQIHAP